MKSHNVHWLFGLEPRGKKDEEECANRVMLVEWKGTVTVSHITHSKQDKWQKWRKDILRHTQTLFSSSWMPLKRSVKMTSLPWEVWLPYRSFMHLVWAVPISWLPKRTLTCLVWAPFLPGRRWGWSSPGPGWILPSGGVSLFITFFSESSVSWLPRFCPLSDLQLRGWPCTVIFEGHLTTGHKSRKMPWQICWS